jgi:hypothetical protein
MEVHITTLARALLVTPHLRKGVVRRLRRVVHPNREAQTANNLVYISGDFDCSGIEMRQSSDSWFFLWCVFLFSWVTWEWLVFNLAGEQR